MSSTSRPERRFQGFVPPQDGDRAGSQAGEHCRHDQRLLDFLMYATTVIRRVCSREDGTHAISSCSVGRWGVMMVNTTREDSGTDMEHKILQNHLCNSSGRQTQLEAMQRED